MTDDKIEWDTEDENDGKMITSPIKAYRKGKENKEREILDIIKEMEREVFDKDRAGRNFNRGWNKALKEIKSKITVRCPCGGILETKIWEEKTDKTFKIFKCKKCGKKYMGKD